MTNGEHLVDLGVSARQQFAPLESPYEGTLAACARIREGMALLDKYLGAIERDAVTLLNRPGNFPGDAAPGRATAAPEPPSAAEPARAADEPRPLSGKSWRAR